MAKCKKKPTLETLTADVEAVRKLAHETANNLLSFGHRLRDIHLRLEKIMATQSEAAQQLNAVASDLKATKEQVAKIGTETSSLLEKVGVHQTKIDELLAIIAAGTVTAELQAAIDGVKTASADVKAQSQVVDDLVPDTAPPA